MRNQSEEHSARTYSQCSKKTMDKGKETFEKGHKNNGKERKHTETVGEKKKEKEKKKGKKEKKDKEEGIPKIKEENKDQDPS